MPPRDALPQDEMPSRQASLPERRPVAVFVLCLIALGVVGWLNLAYGAVNLSPGDVWSGLTSDSKPFERLVVWEVRYPRLLAAMLAGGCLAVAGALLQGVTRSPLADPTILGLTAACGLASAIALVIEPQVDQWLLVVATMGGGLAGAGLLFIIAWRGVVSPVRLALSGVALSAFLGAAIVALLASSRTFLQTSLGFLAGGMYGAGWSELYAMLPYALPCFLLAWLLADRLNVLALGEDVATSLGLLTDRARLLVLGICGVLTAAAVSVAGLVSFVGLVCPHLARYTIGQDNRLVIPFAALYGAILVAGADLIARTVIAPSEIPMGIITAAVGAPFLLYLVRFR